MAKSKTIEIDIRPRLTPSVRTSSGFTLERTTGLVYMRGYMDRASAEDGKPGDPIRFVAANEGMQADRLDLQMDGADLDRFMRNPVILWAHDYRSVPIGRAVEVFVDGTKLIEDIVFDQADEFATKVEAKYRGGWLNAVSIGFDPWTVVDETGKSVSWWQGGTVTEWELLETSCVPVPMDADALVDGRSRAALLDDLSELAYLIDPTRAGAVLSARNKKDLEDARDLIQRVLASAAKEEDSDEDSEEDRAAEFLQKVTAAL